MGEAYASPSLQSFSPEKSPDALPRPSRLWGGSALRDQPIRQPEISAADPQPQQKSAVEQVEEAQELRAPKKSLFITGMLKAFAAPSSSHPPPLKAAPTKPKQKRKTTTPEPRSEPDQPSIDSLLPPAEKAPKRQRSSTPSQLNKENRAPVKDTRKPFSPADFAGVQGFARNAASSTQSLTAFLTECRKRQAVMLGIIWQDCTNNHVPVTSRLCTPKGHCPNWYCSCDKHVRAMQQNTPLLGAVMYFAGDQHSYFVALGRCKSDPICDNGKASNVLPIGLQSSYEERLNCFIQLLNDNTVTKVIFNAQLALLAFMRSDMPAAVAPAAIFDPKVAAWATETDIPEANLELNALMATHNLNFAFPLSPNVGRAAACIQDMFRDLTIVEQLYHHYLTKLQAEDSIISFNKIEMALLPILSAMESRGINADRSRLRELQTQISGLMDRVEANACDQAQDNFNLASPEQVADTLYTRLGLPAPPLKGSQKHPSTGEEVLESLKDKHPVVGMILDYRALAKIKHSYLDTLLAYTGHSTTIHTEWNQCNVRTGRLSSTKPPLQTIPKAFSMRDVDISVRSAFCCSRAGRSLLAADYSQIEMRVLAHVCGDPSLLGLFDRHGDVYARLAAQIMHKQIADVVGEERNKAKVVCLGLIYGMGVPQVAKKLKLSVHEAQNLVNNFMRAFPKIGEFIERTKRFARQFGFVRTMTGRKRHVPEITSDDATKRSQAERQAVNSIIQGTASDIMKLAMIRLNTRLAQHPEARRPHILLQIHDELVIECDEGERSMLTIREELLQCMTQEVAQELELVVPLEVNFSVGQRWGEMTPLPV